MRLTQLLLLLLLWTGCEGQVVVHGSMPDPRWMGEVRTAKGWLTIQVPAECKKTWYDIVVTSPVPGSKPIIDADYDPRYIYTWSDYPQDTIYRGRMRAGESITKYVLVTREFMLKARRDTFEAWSGSIRFSVPSHRPEKELTHVAEVSCEHWWKDPEAEKNTKAKGKK